MAAGALISMPEIAELAGVRRPVVTNWRRRHPDFPAPVAAGQRLLFDATQVVGWLADTGRGGRAELTADLRLHLLTTLAAPAPASGPARPPRSGPQATPQPRTLLAAITALICLRYVDDKPLPAPGHQSWQAVAEVQERAAKVDPDDRLLQAEIAALGPGLGQLPGAVEELIEAAWGCQGAYERVWAARRRFGGDEIDADAVTAPVATLVARLSGAREHADRHGTVRLAAPYAGAGDLLVAVLDQLGEDAEATVTAAEPDAFLARLLRRRLRVRGLSDTYATVAIDHTVPEAVANPDVVVTRLPYRAKEQRDRQDLLAPVERLTAPLNPGRTAVVLGPADLLVGPLAPYHPAAASRRTMLLDGRVEAVIHLPGGAVPYRPGYPAGVWVLRREETSPWQDRVLLADVSDRWLPEVADDLVEDVTTWRRYGHRPDQHLRAYATQVRARELTLPRVRLAAHRPPQARELTGAHETVARVWELETALDPAAASAHDPPAPVRSQVAVRPEPASVPRRTIGVLCREGALAVRPGARLAPAHVVPDGQHRVIGAAELTGRQPFGSRTVDRTVLADRYPRARLTEPGDVVVTLTPGFGVHLDEEGFAVVEFPARVLRIPADGPGVFTPRVLAALLATLPRTGHATERADGAVRGPARLSEVQLPVLSRGEMQRLDELLAAAAARRQRARREIDAVDELCRITTTGLVQGTLSMAGAGPLGPSR